MGKKTALLLLALAALILLSTREGPSALPSAYGPFDQGWKGCSQFWEFLQRDYGAKLLTTDYSVLAQYRDAVLITLGPIESFSDWERTQLINFLAGGGTLILVADVEGTGNTLNLGVKISNYLLRDPGSYERRPDFVVLRSLEGEIFSGVSAILTNYPSYVQGKKLILGDRVVEVIEPVPGLGTLNITSKALTTPQAYPDKNRNGAQDPDEPSGSYPVIIAGNFPSGGRLVLIADPGIFINNIIQSNRYFAQSLLEWATKVEPTAPLQLGVMERKIVLLDLTHSGHGPELWLWSAWLTDKFFLLSLGLVAVAVYTGRAGRVKPPAKPSGRLMREMEKCTKASRSSTKADFSLPFLACYRHFLRRCGRLLGTEPSPREILEALRERLPKEFERVAETVRIGHLVEQGVLRTDAGTSKRLISSLREVERSVEEWSKR